MQRVKGATWEREVARMFRAYFKLGAAAKRGYQTRSGRDGADVEGTPFWIECKHGRYCQPEAALIQAEKASDGDGRTPIAVCKSDRSKPFVAIRLDRFLALAGLAFEMPHDPLGLLARIKPVDLAALVADGALNRDFAVTPAGSGKLTLPGIVTRSRRPKR